MKNLLLILTLSMCIPALAKTDNITKAVAEASVLTDLGFCIQMSSGDHLTKDIDGLIYKGLDCNNVIESAVELGISEDRIHEQVITSLRKSSINMLKECLSEKIGNIAISCDDLEKEAMSLGLSKSEIKKEIGVLKYFID